MLAAADKVGNRDSDVFDMLKSPPAVEKPATDPASPMAVDAAPTAPIATETSPDAAATPAAHEVQNEQPAPVAAEVELVPRPGLVGKQFTVVATAALRIGAAADSKKLGKLDVGTPVTCVDAFAIGSSEAATVRVKCVPSKRLAGAATQGAEAEAALKAAAGWCGASAPPSRPPPLLVVVSAADACIHASLPEGRVQR